MPKIAVYKAQNVECSRPVIAAVCILRYMRHTFFRPQKYLYALNILLLDVCTEHISLSQGFKLGVHREIPRHIETQISI